MTSAKTCNFGLRLHLAAGLFACLLCAPACSEKPHNFRWRWVYAPCNFLVNGRVDELISLMRRAKNAGYNGVVITDWKWGRFAGRPPSYYQNLERTKQEADLIGIELIPVVMGQSTSILQNDPNLAEGIAVRDCVFVVKNGKAAVANTNNLLPFGGLEKAKNNRPLGWDSVDGSGKSLFHDKLIKHTGDASLRMENFFSANRHGHCRLKKELTLLPWHQYRISLFIKTQNVEAPEKIKVSVRTKGRELSYSSLKVQQTQDWDKHEVMFNTLDNGQVVLWLGAWGIKGGKVWIDDVELRECAGINLLRREGCPVKVTSMDGKTIYQEGLNYEKWFYPKIGRKRWAGDYHVTHREPPIYITKSSAIKDGQHLKVSYYHTLVIYDHQVCCCLRNEELFGYFEEQVRQVNRYFEPEKFFMNHDEIRVIGQCQLCRSGGLTAGQLLAENVSRCASIIRKCSPNAEIFVWSDMFDPYSNARDNYYFASSTLEKSWEGLDSSIRVVNWNAGNKMKASLRFFCKRGHEQVIAGYYDKPDVKAEIRRTLNAIQELPKPSVNGIMYTTWRKNYEDLEKFLTLFHSLD